MENKERKETRKEVERLPYEQYRDNGRKSNTRKINKPNSFKKKIYRLIKQATEEDELLGRSLSIMLLVNHISAHEGFLLENIEKENNYYRTYENIQKSLRSVLPAALKMPGHIPVLDPDVQNPYQGRQKLPSL